MLSGKKVKMSVRQAKLSDVPRLLEIDAEIWPDFRATREMFESRIETFPQGQFVVVVDGLVVGSAYSELIDYSVWSDKRFTWQEITNNGTIRQTHVVNGDSFYGVGMAVAKNFQGSVASELLTKSAVKLVITRNIRQILLGARIPSYHKYADRFLVEDYIKQTKGSRLLDPELAFYGKYDGHPIKILPNYNI